MTDLEENSDIRDYQKAKEGILAAVDQRQLSLKASIADTVAEVENDRQESVRKLLRPMTCQLKCSCDFSQEPAALKEVGQAGDH